MKNQNGKKKKIYERPKIRSEKILEAGLGPTCNGGTGGGRKNTTTVPACSVIKT